MTTTWIPRPPPNYTRTLYNSHILYDSHIRWDGEIINPTIFTPRSIVNSTWTGRNGVNSYSYLLTNGGSYLLTNGTDRLIIGQTPGTDWTPRVTP